MCKVRKLKRTVTLEKVWDCDIDRKQNATATEQYSIDSLIQSHVWWFFPILNHFSWWGCVRSEGKRCKHLQYSWNIIWWMEGQTGQTEKNFGIAAICFGTSRLTVSMSQQNIQTWCIQYWTLNCCCSTSLVSGIDPVWANLSLGLSRTPGCASFVFFRDGWDMDCLDFPNDLSVQTFPSIPAVFCRNPSFFIWLVVSTPLKKYSKTLVSWDYHFQ